ncbi:MAG TPA: beta-L-arabinofuranosidase domain-containing protein [Vicinamibacterales bacterium]|nr:beta-L-arabinofuranosidase domain-containing protein [Vicinamibacterales bacterium]
MKRRDFLKAAPAAVGLAVGAPASALRASAGPGASARQPPSPRDDRISSTSYQPAEYPIRPQPYSAVSLTDRFWRPKVATNARVTIPFEVEKLSALDEGFRGNVLEAAMLSLKTHPDPALEARVEARVAQLKTRRARGNAGFEAAVTRYVTTGRRDLLDPAIAAAQEIYDDFVTNNPPFSGGERDAINCLQLYRATRARTHLDLAKHYLDIRGLENSVNRSRHNQSYLPVLEQTEAVGHAVNCVSLLVSLVDVGVFTGLREYVDAAVRMWTDIVTRKMYVTGGVGTTGNEGFGEPYVLPAISAYSETCAVLMFMTLNHRLFLASGDSRYIDVMERGMYNNALSGVSTGGDRFFYVNRLASAGDGRDTRWQHASLECCPPNLVRFLAGMPGLIYAQDRQDAIYVNLYVSSESSFSVGGQPLAFAMTSGMPWNGRSTLRISTPDGIRATVRLRIPGWARNQPVPGTLYRYTDGLDRRATVSLNGASVDVPIGGDGYVSLDRTWKNGDLVDVEFPMAVRHVAADDRVREARRRVAIERGPIVYCVEAHDAGGPVLELALDTTRPPAAEPDDAFGGAIAVRTAGAPLVKPKAPRPITAIPYFLWANRGAAEMTVWLPSSGLIAGDAGPAGGFIFYENPNYERDGWRYLEAAPFDQSAGAPWGCFRRAIPGAKGTAIGTGRQNTADVLASCSDPSAAAALCASLSINGVRGWFLPSRDELAVLYRSLKNARVGNLAGAGASDNVSYWTSTQATADMAHHIDFADEGRQHYDDKDFPRRVRAIRQV